MGNKNNNFILEERKRKESLFYDDSKRKTNKISTYELVEIIGKTAKDMNLMEKLDERTPFEKDVDYLKALNDSMHSWQRTYSKVYGEGHVHKFKDEQYDSKVMKKAYDLVKNNDKLVMYPDTGNFGFAPVFVVAKLENILHGMKIKKENILYIDEKQLPKRYNFDRLSKLWKIPEKAEYLKRLNITIEYKSYYYY